jgi:hypothetical protein
MRREISLNTKEPDGPSLCDDCPPVNYPTDKTRCGPCPRRKGETACLSAVATNEPCLPDSTLKRCTICGFIVDTQYAAELPPRNAAASALSETKEPGAKPAAAGDLERARALLADDPDEMDEEWLAGIITAIRAEAVAAERERCVKIAENPGFIQAQDTEWDMGVEYAKPFIARAIRSGREP